MKDSTQDKIAAIQKEIRDTPYHKGTEHHIGKLKARLAKLKDELYQIQLRQKGGGGSGFAISHSGDASIALVGFPSVGKSTLLNALTNAKSKVASYDFTTLSVIPGMLFYQGAYIQIFDIPGLITGASTGRGRGKQVLAVSRAADLILIIADASHPHQISTIQNELYQAGVRLNQSPPQITILKKDKGGIILHSNIKQDFSEQTLIDIAHELGLRNAEITLKQGLSLDDLIDAIAGNRAYTPAITVINKIDSLPTSLFNKLKKQYPQALYISAQNQQGLDQLKQVIWESLKLLRIYLKRPGQKQPDYAAPLIAIQGQTLKSIADKLNFALPEDVKLAKISGPGAAYPDQKVPLTTLLQDQMEASFI